MNKLLIVLVVALVGFGGYFFLDRQRVAPEATEELVEEVQPTEEAGEPILGGDADEHGCIGSAGYTWCEPLGKCVRLWEEACVAEEADTGVIEAAVKEQIVAKRGEGAVGLEIVTQRMEGDYALGSARDPEPMAGGGMWFAALVEDEWKLVWDGNGVITCDEVAPYPDFPSSMIPECFDEASGEMVAR